MPANAFVKKSQKNTQNTENISFMNYILKRTEKFNPTIRSLVMVEKLICENKELESKSQLYKKLPTGMQYPIFNFILEILERQNKIMLDKDGSIFWIGSAGKKLQKRLEKAVEY
ncbi:MAG: hypothetical protein WD154_02105 [Nitrosopumilaceae archaeon]